MIRQSVSSGSRFFRDQRGVSLIEVLVALLVLSFGLMGTAALQATGVRTNQSAATRSLAVSYAYDIADRMRSNAVELTATRTAYDIAMGATAAGGGQASVDLAQWKAGLAADLPSGDGAVAFVAASNQWLITVNWDVAAASRAEAATTKSVQLSVEVF